MDTPIPGLFLLNESGRNDTIALDTKVTDNTGDTNNRANTAILLTEERQQGGLVVTEHLDASEPAPLVSNGQQTQPSTAHQHEEAQIIANGSMDPIAENITQVDTSTELQSLRIGSSKDALDIALEANKEDLSSESESDEEAVVVVDRTARERLLALADGDGDDEDDATHNEKGVRSKNEIEPTVSAIEKEFTLSPNLALVQMGTVQEFVSNVVIIKGNSSGDYQVYDEGTYVFAANRKIIGVVFETFGRVSLPMYSLRFESPEVVAGLNLSVGEAVFQSPAYSKFVLTNVIRNQKGSDASNLHDEEVADHVSDHYILIIKEREFSDDEAEAQFKRQKKRQVQSRKLFNQSTGAVGAAASFPNLIQPSGASPARPEFVYGR